MNTSVKEALEALWLPFCLSMMGFIVRTVRFGVASWRTFFSSLFCSAFAGIVAHWFLAGSGIDTQIASAVIAMSGYCGGALIDAISERILREVKDVSHAYISSRGTPSEGEIIETTNEDEGDASEDVVSESSASEDENTESNTPHENK